MRFNNRVEFVNCKREYNPYVGEYTQVTESIETVACFVMDIGLGKQVQVFGDYKRDRQRVFLRHEYKGEYTHLRFKNKFYKVVTDRQNSRVLYIEGDSSVEV